MHQKQPKILVLGHNCFSESSANGRTLSTFFRLRNKDKVAQFYVNNEIPSSKVCNSFYRITDKNILDNIFKSKSYGGIINNEVQRQKPILKNTGASLIRKLKKFKSFFPSVLYILIDLLWRNINFNSKELKNWVDEFKPDLILLQPGDYSFLYRMARTLSQKKKIPLIVYNSEDYYLKDRFSISPFFYIQRYNFKKEIKKTYNTAKIIIYSNDLLEKNLHKFFKSNSSVILTSSEIKLVETKSKNDTIRLLYAGNLSHERWKSLVVIGKILKKIHSNLHIDVYSGEIPKEANANFTISNGINFKGSVSYNEILKVINEADIVIHTEGFSNLTKWDIRHGFSTKIADLLSSGKCFLIYGPKGIACVDYLSQNEVAWIANSELELENVLREILNSEKQRGRYLEKAKQLVNKRHNLIKNCRIFEDLILDVYNNKYR